jgi:hypothetical protein
MSPGQAPGMPALTMEPSSAGSDPRRNNIPARTLADAYADSPVDSGEETDENAGPQTSTRVFAPSTHPEPPFNVDRDVARSSVGNGRAQSSPFPPFSPSELQKYSSPSPSGSEFGPLSPSELRPLASSPQAHKFGSGFSPRHAHWDPSHEYDEVYELASSPEGSPRLPPRVMPLSPPRNPQPVLMMSPGTRSAAESLVPSLSWLLILNRKLFLSGAISVEQSRHLKGEILSGRPELLSAVDRFVKKERDGDSEAIIEALLACLPDVSQEEEQEEEQAAPSDENEDEFTDSDDDDAAYNAILNGRGEGGHKSLSATKRPKPTENSDGEPEELNGSRIQFGEESDEESEEEGDNPLILANTLLPLSLQQLESLGWLTREAGFRHLDLETLHLCTSNLLPSSPLSRSSPDGGAVPAVGFEAWQECIKELRLHASNPKLMTALLQQVYRALDLHGKSAVPYGELVSSLAIFCSATPAQKLKFVFGAMLHNGRAASQPTASPLSPHGDSAAPLAATSVYGFLFSFSLVLHVLLHLASGAKEEASTVINLEHKGVWQLTNNLYSLFDAQFGVTSDAADESALEAAHLSYAQILAWKANPAVLLDALLERGA